MDRFVWLTSGLEFNENKLCTQTGVKIYDGEDKTSFEDGVAVITTFRIIWRDQDKYQIALPLSLVVFAEWQAGGIGKSPKITLHLQAVPPSKAPGPISRSRYDYIKFSFKNGGDIEFHKQVEYAIQKQSWQQAIQPTLSSGSLSQTSMTSSKVRGAGIVGIERKMEEAKRQTDENISVAFQDLSKLIEKAKEMVTLSTNIASKIKDKKGDITDDETVKFKSYLLSLGIPNPVTKETHGSGTHYHMQLAHEISKSLTKQIEESGGMMLLSDAYCRINRARGMELLSPEDLFNACKVMNDLKLSLKLRRFDTGVLVLQVKSQSDEMVIQQTTDLVTESTSLSSQELASLLSISVLLARERLFLAESNGMLCRDDSDEGLRFYPNFFLTRG